MRYSVFDDTAIFNVQINITMKVDSLDVWTTLQFFIVIPFECMNEFKFNELFKLLSFYVLKYSLPDA